MTEDEVIYQLTRIIKEEAELIDLSASYHHYVVTGQIKMIYKHKELKC